MEKKIVIRAIAGGVCLMALSGAASAQSLAYTNQPVDVYAGPSGDYPVVAQVPPGAQLAVYGCVSDYSWCDVEAPGLRGWIYGGYLDYPYQGTQVPIMTYGVQIGLPVVAFSFGTYWDHYYRGQPWYHDRDRWANHPPPMRGGPPPHGGPAAAGGPAMNPRAVMHGGPQPQPQPGYAHEPTQPQQGYAHGPAQPQPGYAHGPAQPQPGYAHGPAQPQPGYAHEPAQPPRQMMGAPQGQAAVHPGGPSGEHGGEARGGNGDHNNHPPDNH